MLPVECGKSVAQWLQVGYKPNRREEIVIK